MQLVSIYTTSALIKLISTKHFRSTNLTERVAALEADLQQTTDQLNSTKDELSQYKSENRGLREEMKVINEVMCCRNVNDFF